MPAFRVLILAVFFSIASTFSFSAKVQAASLSALQESAMSSFSGIRFFAEQESMSAIEINEAKLSPETKDLLKSHLTAIEGILKKTQTKYSRKAFSVTITGGESPIGQWVEKNRKLHPGAKFIYRPMELVLSGADASYHDLTNEMNLSAGAVIEAKPDSSSEHELLHLKVSRDKKTNPAVRPIFFVDKLGESLRSNAYYYGTFLRADEILTHLYEFSEFIKSNDESEKQFALDKLEVLNEVVKTNAKMAREFRKAAKENRLTLVQSPEIRGNRNVLAVGPWRLDLNMGDTQDPKLVEPILKELASLNSMISRETRLISENLNKGQTELALSQSAKLTDQVQSLSRVQFPGCRALFNGP